MDKLSLVKLDGTAITESGKVKKHSMFQFLDYNPNDYSNISFTPEEAQKLRSHLQYLSTGSSAVIPLKCGGSNHCPFASNCPLVRLEKERKVLDPEAPSPVPLLSNCLVETNLLNEWTRLYIQEYEIDESSFTEFQMARELAEIELLLWRLNNNLSKPEHAELVQETNVGVDKQGNILTKKEVNAIFEAKERLQNRKSKVIKLMVGDRQEKYKRDAALKTQSEEDVSTNAARLRTQIDTLLTKAKTLDYKLKESEGKVLEVNSSVDELTPEDLINDG